MARMERIPFRASRNLRDQLEQAVEKRDVNRSQYVREAIRRQLQHDQLIEYEETNE